MLDNLFHTKEHQVYPGEYVPRQEIRSLLDEIKTLGKNSAANPAVNMDELDDCYKVEMIIPGVRREDIFIYILENVLSIVVLYQPSKMLKKEKLQIHEFDKECIDRHIFLPENADAEFASAEYQQGVLRIHLPKNKKPLKANINQIVVY